MAKKRPPWSEAADRAADKRAKVKEGSKRDVALDKKAAAGKAKGKPW